MSYVYLPATGINSLTDEPVPRPVYKVGFYRPDGTFQTERRTANQRAAAARTSWLNGGSYCDIIRLDEESPQPW
jgi:hypothetical protein